jgi:hypothetical protein
MLNLVDVALTLICLDSANWVAFVIPSMARRRPEFTIVVFRVLELVLTISLI